MSTKAWRQSDRGKASQAARTKRYRASASGIATELRYKTEHVNEIRDANAAWCKANGPRLQRAKRAWLDSFKTAPCADCGVTYPPIVMDFDHVRGVKVSGVANMLRRASYEAMLTEIAKCDVVCANCHRIRTFNRRRHVAMA